VKFGVKNAFARSEMRGETAVEGKSGGERDWTWEGKGFRKKKLTCSQWRERGRVSRRVGQS